MLAARIVFGLIICAAIFCALHSNAGLLNLIGLTILLAITQGELPTWRKIGNAVAKRIEKNE